MRSALRFAIPSSFALLALSALGGCLAGESGGETRDSAVTPPVDGGGAGDAELLPDAGFAPDADEDLTPPSFSGLESARVLGPTSIELRWSAASDDRTHPEQILYHAYTSTLSGREDFSRGAIASVTGETHLVLEGLLEGREYFFVVRASDLSGNQEQNSVERSAEIPDLTAPMFAGATRATASAGRVRVAWSPATDNSYPSEALRYRLYIGTGPGAQHFSQAVATTTAGATSAEVSGLADAVTYYFVARAFDPARNEDQNRVEVSATTPDVHPPLFAGAAGAVASPSAITLSWGAAADNVTPVPEIRYRIFTALSPGAEDFSRPDGETPPGAESYAAGGLAASTHYYFVVRAIDLAGNEDDNRMEVDAVTPDLVDRMPPSFAGASGARAVSATELEVSWLAAGDDFSPADAIQYELYAATSSGAESFAAPTAVTLAGATSARIDGLSPASTHFFVVRARDQAGNLDANTQEVSATTLPDTTPPIFSGIQSAAATSTTSVVLGWIAAGDDTSAPEQITYLIYRALDFSAPIAESAPGATGIAVTGLTPATEYRFSVRARDLFGNIDANTRSLRVTTPAPPNMPPSFAGAVSANAINTTMVELSWSPARDDQTPEGSIVYLIYTATSSGAESFAAPSYSTPAGATSFVAGRLRPNQTHYFVVRARDGAGASDANTVEVSATTAAATVSFASDVQPIFSASCASRSCHGSGPFPGGALTLSSAATSYAQLVGVPSSQCFAVHRVEPGDSGTSYLMWKLDGRGPCFSGTQMPRLAPPLSMAQRNLIRTWIDEGAANN